MSDAETSAKDKKPDRKLGDEWLEWDGRSESTETNKRVFIGLAGVSIVLLIGLAALFFWLILPRMLSLGWYWPEIAATVVLGFTILLVLWIAALTFSVATGRPAPKFVLMPALMNRMLSLVAGTGGMLGISTDRVTNSFLKVHNTLLRARPRRVPAERLLILAPRCLTKGNNKGLREIRDKFGVHMSVVGGGTEARKKIHQTRPQLIIALACERDLRSGFVEINPKIPVIGIPNQRPEGPCKNTCVDLNLIEQIVVRNLRTES